MEQHHKVNLPLGHRLDVAEATQHLLHRLGCDSWYVACHREHLYVLHLTKGGMKHYAVCFECTSPVDKGVYHGSQASAVSILPLGQEHDLSPEAVKEIQAELMELAWAPHA